MIPTACSPQMYTRNGLVFHDTSVDDVVVSGMSRTQGGLRVANGATVLTGGLTVTSGGATVIGTYVPMQPQYFRAPSVSAPCTCT
jgi:hypothetical protein